MNEWTNKKTSEQASSGSQPGEICPPASPFQGYIGNIMRHFHLSYHGVLMAFPGERLGCCQITCTEQWSPPPSRECVPPKMSRVSKLRNPVKLFPRAAEQSTTN